MGLTNSDGLIRSGLSCFDFGHQMWYPVGMGVDDSFGDEKILFQSIQNLKQGLMTNNWAMALKAHAELIRNSEAAIPVVEAEMAAVNLSRLADPGAMAIYLGLSALLRHLDEAKSDHVLDQVLALELHAPLRAALTTIRNTSENHFRCTTWCDIGIWESKSVRALHNATHHVANWLRSIDRSIVQDIQRIYIITPEQDPEILGSYSPYLFNIALVWTCPNLLMNPVAPVIRLTICKTLFHEIGHHVYRHSDGDEELQELEAELFAHRLLGQTFKKSGVLIRAIQAMLAVGFKRFRDRQLYYVGLRAEGPRGSLRVWFQILSRNELSAVFRCMVALEDQEAANIRLIDLNKGELDPAMDLQKEIPHELGRTQP